MQGLFYVFIIVDFVLGFFTGLLGAATLDSDKAKGSWLYPLCYAYPGLEVAGLLTSLTALATSGVSFGLPDLGSRRCHIHLAAALWILAYGVPTIIVLRFTPGFLREVGELVFCFLSLPTILIGVRGWPLLVACVLCICGAFVEPPFSLMLSKVTFTVICCAFTRYLRDQRLVFCVMAQPICSYALGHHVGESILDGGISAMVFATSIIGFTIVYTNLLLRRRHRHLPPGLQKARFVRLGYLREMVARGEHIRRCQEMPEKAFGDPMKAQHLVIISHRWLDPKTSDLVTEKYPTGLKLERLVQRLEEKFCPRIFRRSAGSWSLAKRVHSACSIGGWDVLVFFDFMSIPQDGLTADGLTIPRTVAEKAIFEECLPNMGTLYSLFPVLALTEVPEDDSYHGYMQSGWCVCEFTIALLGKQLESYSQELLCDFESRQRFDSEKSMGEKDAARLVTTFSSQLNDLRFLHESDREVAQGIIKAFLGKRLLVDLIWQGDIKGVERVLDTLAAHNLQAALSEPVDSGLNTLLHMAVQAKQCAAVDLLLQHGAPASARNLRGDLPTQWLALPRLGRAARKCRRAGRGSTRSPSDWSASGTVAQEASRRPSAMEAVLSQAEGGVLPTAESVAAAKEADDFVRLIKSLSGHQSPHGRGVLRSLTAEQDVDELAAVVRNISGHNLGSGGGGEPGCENEAIAYI